MLDLSTSYLQALLWSTALWLALPLTVSLCTGREASFNHPKAREARALNLGFWLFEALALGPVLWLLSLICLGAGPYRLESAQWDGWSEQTLSFILSFLLALWLGDGIATVRHRLEHTRYLWHVHAWHHTVDASDWLQTHRHHPLSRIIAFFGEVVLLAAMLDVIFGTIPWPAMLLAMACRRAYAIWLHAGSHWGMDRWIARHIVLPGHHRAHHAGAPIYSGMFRHWDDLCSLWSERPSLHRLKASRRISVD
jgi:sterol desaturase/sphingolipid hydroxylase (fatty acid hydroxylase superfamily)